MTLTLSDMRCSSRSSRSFSLSHCAPPSRGPLPKTFYAYIMYNAYYICKYNISNHKRCPKATCDRADGRENGQAGSPPANTRSERARNGGDFEAAGAGPNRAGAKADPPGPPFPGLRLLSPFSPFRKGAFGRLLPLSLGCAFFPPFSP